MDPVSKLRGWVPGTRVVVRYRIATGATDALGTLIAVDEVSCTVDTRRGPDQIELSTVLLAKEVPPAPPRRAARQPHPGAPGPIPSDASSTEGTA